MSYSEEHKRNMVWFYNSLSSEKDKLHYAAVEAQKLGEVGVDYICSLFGCDKDALRRRMSESDT